MSNFRRLVSSVGAASAAAAGFAAFSALVKKPRFFEHSYVAPMTAAAPYAGAAGALSLASAGLLASTKQYKSALAAAAVGGLAIYANQYKMINKLPARKRNLLERNDIRVYVHNIFTENKDQGKKLGQQIALTNPDIVVITEANLYSIQKANAALSGYLYQNWENLGQDTDIEKNKKFDGIFVASKLPFTDFNILDECGRAAVECIIHVGDKKVKLIATHTSAPVTKRWGGQWARQLTALNAYLKRTVALDDYRIVVGDFNATVGHALFRSLVKDNNLVDVSKSAPTWPVKGNGFKTPLPLPVLGLDHILVSRNIFPVRVQKADSAASDHLPLIADLRIL